MWTPNLLFAAVGLVGLWRIRRPGNSPHGGDWSDVLEPIRRVIGGSRSALAPLWRTVR